MAINGITNGVNGTNGTNGTNYVDDATPEGALYRFEYLPKVLDIQIDEGNDVVEIELEEELNDDPTELCTLLENEAVKKVYWISMANAYAKQQRIDQAIDVLKKGHAAFRNAPSVEQLSFLNALIWMYLWKARQMPVSIANDLDDLFKEIASGKTSGLTNGSHNSDDEKETRQKYVLHARRTINEAMRIDPRSLPLTLARGTLYLIEAGQMQYSQPQPGTQDRSERTQKLQEALNTFDAVIKASGQRSIMAAFGRARSLFLLGRFGDAHAAYQDILRRAPHQVDPDPRIGIGCCLWQLGHYEDARAAWERALEVTPESKIAHIYLGISWLHSSAQYPTSDPRFREDYEKAISEYVSKAFKLDQWFPLSCSTFASYFMMKRQIPNGQKLAYRAIRGTDVKPISSDAWYLVGRSKHAAGELEDALAAYRQADDLRGGEKLGYLPAKLGVAQVLISQSQNEMSDTERMRNLENAKVILEEMVKAKSIEAMEILGTVLAEEVFAAQHSPIPNDKSKEMKRAIGMLEQVRVAWKDPKKNMTPDPSVLLNLARLYEGEFPEKSLQCLQQVEQMELDGLPDELKPAEITDELALKSMLREYLPPQLLNNMGVLLFQGDRTSHAREMFQAALNACVKIGDQDATNDTDALVTTISFNLARTYEAENMADEAEKVYRGLLSRHPDYTDGNARLAYIQFRKDPKYHGDESIEMVYQANKENLDVRALYGWWCNKVKRKTLNVADDQEQRFYKVTLQQHDKHDVYSLTGMGNIYLAIAREMRRDTDDDRMKRKKIYEKAVEFFDKALQYDPNNAYAAQGIAIAMAEDRKDHGQAVQLLSKIREAVKDASVYINLGHVYYELKQFSRAIESYEQALMKDQDHQAAILLYLGRVWFTRGRTEKSLAALKQCLEYTRQALAINRSEITVRFNIALIQSQIASLIITLQTTQRTLADVSEAQTGLDEAIVSFRAIAAEPNPPYPKNVIEQRANMSANTMKKQLERAAADQTTYEEKNAAKLQAAKEAREAEMKRREDEKRKVEEAKAEANRKLLEERQAMQERDRELAKLRQEEEARLEEAMMTTDSETGERKKREKKKRAPRPATEDGEDGEARPERRKRSKKGKRKGRDDASDDDEEARLPGSRGGSGSPEPAGKKRKRLSRRASSTVNKGKPSTLSNEFIDDSDISDTVPDLPEDEDEEDAAAATTTKDVESELSELDEEPDFGAGANGDDGTGIDNLEIETPAADAGVGSGAKRPKKQRKKQMRVVNEEDDDDSG